METIINNLLEKKLYSEPIQIALRMFDKGEYSPIALRDKLKALNTSLKDIHSEAIDVVIDFVNAILDDHIITEQEMSSLRRLKMFLHIKEGDFIKANKEGDIEKILHREFELIFLDKVVDKEESAMKVHLQELFGLSYDQFLLFEQEAVEYAIKHGADITDLDTFYRL